MTLPISRHLHSTDPQPGVEVADVQRHLRRRGFSVGPTGVDGRYGSATETAVVRFQTHRGIHVDGIVGEETWGLLSRSFPKPDPAPVSGLTQAQRAALILYERVTGTDGHPRMQYVFGHEIALSSTRYPTEADCSETTQFAIYQVTGDDWVDGSAAQYAAGDHCSLDYARTHEGVLVFLTYNGRGSGIHHVGMTKKHSGVMGVAQARSAYLNPECGWWPFNEQGWALACRVPIIHY